jgi:SRSO17 transposase
MEIEKKEMNQEFNNLMHRLAHIFASDPGFNNAQKYLKGLLGTAERKNGWQIAEYLGEKTPYALQQFIYRGQFSADEMRDAGRAYIVEHIGSEDGVLVVDETGFIKKGVKSCGVARQYSGTAGRIENCQIGVFLTYASDKGHCPIDRRLYIPDEWTSDRKRMWEAGVPEWEEFKTKPQLALRMIKEATKEGVAYRWVTGDCVYGDNRVIREWLERNQKSYVFCLSRKEYIDDGKQYTSVNDILKNLPEEGWYKASCGDGSKGKRIYDWYIMNIKQPREEGFQRWLLVRRSQSDKNDLQAYICFSLADTTKEELIKVAGTRWTVETCFEESKSEVGMDEYEFRSYDGWYKHITFSILALALLTVLSSQSMDKESIQKHNPSGLNLEDFKKKARFACFSKGDLRKILSHWFDSFIKKPFEHLKNWIEWRREHQIVAMWHHYHKLKN